MTGSTASPGAVLVDGYNVLHAVPRFAPRGAPLEPARRSFQSWLARAARGRGVGEVVLVWDGRAGGHEARAPDPLTVLYTSEDKTADERILELCRGRYADRSASTWVVSSDREVQGPARQLGFEAIGAMTFYRRWSRGGPSGGRGAGPRSSGEGPGKPRRATRREVEELLDEFLRRGGEEPEG
ncbi:MAG: NYN domain-containing protein [Gemmatimonadetes bacterium]|nr:NYN domain-containing protein [Gemmatimonadota bacterium]